MKRKRHRVIDPRKARVAAGGVGYELLARFYLGEAPWTSFSLPEQRIIEKTARRFARGLREAGFLSRGEKFPDG